MKSRFLLFFLLAAMFLPMAVNAQETFTVYGGTTTYNATIPFSGANAKYQQRNQMIYYADLLSSISGKDLTAMTFDVYGSPTGDLGNWVVSLAETTAANFNSGASFNTTSLTQVYSGPMVFNSNRTQMIVYFDESFHYNGGNLLVQFSNPDPVNSQTANSAYNFYCSAQLPTAQKQSYAYKNFSSGAVVNEQKRYVPRVTFTYDSENANPKPTDLAVNHVDGESTAELSWTSAASAWNIDVNGTVTSVTDNQFTLTGLMMETPCVIKVQADFGGGETSDWATLAFTPTNLTSVGSGTSTSNCLPSYGGDKYSLTEQIYTPEELGGPGLITGLDFYNTTSGATTRKLLIYMLYTEKDSFESGTDWVQVTSSNLVYTGASNATILSTNGWSHINLTTPFDYDGGSNVLIVIDDNTGNYTDGTKNYRCFTTTQKQAIYIHADTPNYDPTSTSTTGASSTLNPANVGTITTSKSQIRVHKGNTPECPKPIGVTFNHAEGATTAQVSWESDAESFNIDVNGTVTNGVTNPYTLTNLTMETAYTIKVQGVCNGVAGDWSRAYTFTPTNIVAVGEGNATSNALPSNTNYNYTLTQQIFTPEEIGEQASIKGVAFYNTGATITRKLAIYMVATDKDNFESVDDRVVVTSSNMVFGTTGNTGGTNVVFAADAWTYIPFTTAFNYDGESNVILVVDDNTNNFNDGARNFLSFTTTEDQAMYFYADDYNPSATSATITLDNFTSNVTTSKNQVQFHKGDAPSCPKPIHLAVSHENGATTAQVTCESDAELFNIDIKVGTAASTIINGVTLPYTLENLVMETKYTIKLQADCGGGDVSAWSNAYTFTPTNLSIAGDGNETSTVLPTNSYKKSLTQQIFTVEELGAPALIKGIELHTADTAIRKFNIYMVATDKDHFESVDDRVVVTNSNLVFGSTTTTNGTNVTFIEDGWTYIPFSTPFDYDGGSNVILVVDDNSAYYGESGCPFLSFTTTENQAMYFYADDYNPDPKVAAATFDPDGNFINDVIDSKNQVIFHKGNPPTCPKPIHVAVNYNGGQTAEVTWESDAESFDIMRGTTTVATGVTGNSYTLTNLSLGTTYNVKVRANCGGGDLSEWTTPVSFTVDQYASMCDIHYTLTDSYNDGWFDNSATPKQHKLLVRKGTTTLYTLTMAAGESPKTGTLHIQDDIDINFYWQKGGTDYNEECGFEFTDAYGKLIFEGNGYDGSGQMGTYHMNCNEVTYTKEIEGYGDGDGRWYFITSPVDFAKVENVENCIDEENEEDYDLFYFDQAAEDGLEWRNYKVESFTLEPGKGYLYANKHDVTLVFTGHPYSGTGSNIPLTYSEGASWAGWNLVGNPLDVPAWPSRDWYWMNNAGTDIILSDWDRPAEPMEGVFVNVVSADEIEMSFDVDSKKGTDRSIAGLSLNLSQGRSVIDRAIVRFDEASPMPKFQLNTSHTKVYIPQGGQDYAMVYSEGMGELPVSFKAEKNGNYTLNSNALGVSFSYLHLIDNMTGADVDLLATPSYTFEARTTDYASRFRLVFVCGDANDDNDFAFFSNGNWVISNDGEATVQVIDMVGRILKSETISGNASISINAAPGVYMLRLINNENMKVQKVVVR